MSEQPWIFRNVDPTEENMRLDRWIKHHFPTLSQGIIQKNLRCRKIRVNDAKTTANTRITPQDSVQVYSSLLRHTARSTPVISTPHIALLETASAVSKWIIHQDPDFLIFNKPQGLATQGGTGLKTSLDQAINLWLKQEGKKETAHLVHRLDKDTSGLLIVALNSWMARQLSTLFRERLMQKTYKAILVGELPKNQGTHHCWMLKQQGVTREKMTLVPPDQPKAQEAICLYTVLKKQNHLSLVNLEPQTGRMHQLRVQMADMGCPVLGDGKYGGSFAHPERRTTLHLHAESLSFEHPKTKSKQMFQAPFPPHFQDTFTKHHFCTANMPV